MQSELTGPTPLLSDAVLVGSGEQAEIFRTSTRGVAVKVARSADGLGSILSEAEALAWARSPWLPRLLDVGWWSPGEATLARSRRPSLLPCLVLEWIESTNDAASPFAVAHDVASALWDLHAAGVAHGDVKRENTVESARGVRLVDLGLAVPSAQREIVGGTPRYLPLQDADGGTAEARDLLALGVLIAEACDHRVRDARDPIQTTRALGADLRSLSQIIMPLLSTTPSARPPARWVVETTSKALATARTDVISARERAIRAAYLRAHEHRPQGRAHERSATYLEPYLRRTAEIQGAFGTAPRDDVVPLLDAAGVARWLTLLVGPDAAAWPLGSVVDRGENEIGAALVKLAARRTPAAWTFAELEEALATSGPPPLKAPDANEAARVARLAMEVSEVPARVEALDEIEGDSELPPALVLRAAHALRLRGEVGRGAALAERAASTHPAARADLADHFRRAGDKPRAVREARAVLDEPGARAVLGRIALDDGSPDDALALVHGGTTARLVEVEALALAASGDVVAASAALDRGVAHARTDEDRARLFGARGYVVASIDPAAARDAFLRAVDHAMRAGAVVEEATYLTGAAALSVDQGYLESGIHAAWRASLLWEGLGRPERAARAHLARAAGLRILGRRDEALRAATACADAARNAQDDRALLYAHIVASDCANDTGDHGAPQALVVLASVDRLGGVATPDDRLSALSRALIAGTGDVDIVATDAFACASSASAGARFDWWGARARSIPRDERADEILAAIVALAPAKAPLMSKGVALTAGIDLAGERGRADVAERLRGAARDVARMFVGRAGASVEAEVRKVPWVLRSVTHTDSPMDDEQVRDLERLVRSLGTGERLGDLLKEIVDALVLWTGVERGLLLLRAPDGRLVPRAARNFAKHDLEGEQRELPQSLAKRALDAKEPIVAVDAAGELAGLHKSVHALKLRSVLAVPLLARGEAIGVVYLDDRVRRGAFGPKELAWVRTIAALAGSMIEAARSELLLRRSVRATMRANGRLERSLAEREAKIEAMSQTIDRAKGGRGTRHAYIDIVGESEPMCRLLRMVDKVAGSDVPVMVLGESGSGKELIARAIHQSSARADAPFVTENCGAIPEGLLESALFGHVKGAFTGADRSRVGLFEAADHGTLFLDEIGEMSLGMQAKLLRILEDGWVRAVGTERGRKVDVRIIVATHRDLEAMVRDRRFREDLYYRIHIISLVIPPLRERASDIPILVRRFVQKHAPGRPGGVTKAAMDRLSAFAWPGNVRQLENEVRRALVLSDGIVDVEHLSVEIGGGSNGASVDAGLHVRKRVDLLETTLVREAMARTRGNQTQAARLLGLSRFGLQKMMKRLAIGSPEAV